MIVSFVQADPLKELIENGSSAYIYAYPLVLMTIAQQKLTALGPFNTLHLSEFRMSEFTDVVRPNVNALYTSA